MERMEYRPLAAEELVPSLFDHFQRRQEVNLCWRKVDGVWQIREDPFIDDWTPEDYRFLLQCLKNTLAGGGLVLGAFLAGELKGFASVEDPPLGSRGQYADLTSIHVSRDCRRMGAGRELFHRACRFARERGAEALYISAHSAVETQAFYRAMGCVEAQEYNQEHVEREPFDCQLECPL